MTDKTLKAKAISIQGKNYVQVKDRVSFFNEEYPNGMITAEIISDSEKVVVKATVTPDASHPERFFTGISASNPTKTIEKLVPHEIAETSAVGRALAFMGIGVIDSISSVDEMNKAGVKTTPQETVYATEKQQYAIGKLIKEGKIDSKVAPEIPSMSKARASQLLEVAMGRE